jgi:hypothetical protein
MLREEELLVQDLRETWRCCPPCHPSGARRGGGSAAGQCRDCRRVAARGLAADPDVFSGPQLLWQVLQYHLVCSSAVPRHGMVF